MKTVSRILIFTIALLVAFTTPTSSVLAGAEHYEFQTFIPDYNDCTDEDVIWDATIRQTYLDKVTPSGQGLYLDNWSFHAFVEGQTTGYIWETKGRANLRETYSLENSQTGSFSLIENAILKPVSEGAPRIRLDVMIKFAFNAHGELVVDRFGYTYHCND